MPNVKLRKSKQQQVIQGPLTSCTPNPSSACSESIVLLALSIRFIRFADLDNLSENQSIQGKRPLRKPFASLRRDIL